MGLSRGLKIALNVGAWSIIAAYAIFAANYCSQKKGDIVCKGIRVEIGDSASLGFVTPQIVRNMLVNAGVKITGQPLSQIDILGIEREVASRGYVKTCKVYTSIDGYLNIEIRQRRPKMSIRSQNGYNIYISEDNYVLPVQNYFFVDVPIVTGVVELPTGRDFAGPLPQADRIEKKYAENYKFLFNLINFVEFLEKDSFWSSQIVQINIVQGTDVELIPRVGDCIVHLGSLDNYERKLEKLMKFYKKGLAYEGWNKYSYLDIKYDNQIVCKNSGTD